jgi:hypothetical protein
MQRRQLKVVYDVCATPKGLDIATVTKIFENHDVVFWDSSGEGLKPRIYAHDGVALTTALVDTKGKEMDVEYYSKMFKDKEFWDKELHKCLNSPMFFFSNYGTNTWPHTDEDMKIWMGEAGIKNVEAIDDEEAAETWKRQKESIKKALSFITLDLLKERKEVVDILKNAYNVKVNELERVLGPHVKLVDNKNVPLDSKKAIGNVAEKIWRITPIPAKWDKYRTKKNKWDKPMLFMTSYDNLLAIYYDLLESTGKLKQSGMDSKSK